MARIVVEWRLTLCRQSALTDFLAVSDPNRTSLAQLIFLQSQGINANQIRQDADARRAAARASLQNAGGDGDDDTEEPEAAPARKETKAQAAKRKKEEEVIHSTLV